MSLVEYFKPLTIGTNELKNRIIMAPLTRLRNDSNLAPTDLSVKYYSQRSAEGTLLVSEATYISPQTLASSTGPGIWLPEQVSGWKKVTDAVHAKGGLISCQLWHVGRHAHASLSEHHLVKNSGYSTCWAPSEVKLTNPTRNINNEFVESTTPKAFTIEMIQDLRRDYVKAAKNAIEAGFDYVELHAAHGYLPQQFFSTSSNTRTDEYGGSLENRFRFLNEVLSDLVEEVGREKVGIRVSPHSNDDYAFACPDDNPKETFTYCMEVLNKYKLAYVLFTEPRWDPRYTGDAFTDERFTYPAVNAETYGKLLKDTVVMGAGGFTPVSGHDCLTNDSYSAIGFGRWFIANPDLVYRIQNGFPLNRYRRDTFYFGPSSETLEDGYVDYPTFDEVLQQLGYTIDEVKEKEDEIIAKSFEKLKYPLISINSLGNAASLSQVNN